MIKKQEKLFFVWLSVLTIGLFFGMILVFNHSHEPSKIYYTEDSTVDLPNYMEKNFANQPYICSSIQNKSICWFGQTIEIVKEPKE